MKLRRHERGDAGFTLVELTVAIVVLGLISGAVATAISVVLKNEKATRASLVSSSYGNQLNVWFNADVNSADPRAGMLMNIGGAADSGCFGGPPLPGTNKLRLQLHGAGGGPLVVSYRVVGTSLIRASCGASDPTPRSQVLVDGLRGASDVTVTGSGSPLDTLTLTVTTAVEGRSATYTLRASPRAITPTTTLPVNPIGGPSCFFQRGRVVRDQSNPDDHNVRLTASVATFRSVVGAHTVSVDTIGDCPRLRIRFDQAPEINVTIKRQSGCPVDDLVIELAGGSPTWWTTIDATVRPDCWTVTDDVVSEMKRVQVEQYDGRSWEWIGNFEFAALTVSVP
jgi:prepilin-type N-terminal cleavage/methylation domain-containing protein